VCIRFAISHFLLVVNWYRTSIFHRFRDICILLYLGDDLDLLGSRDVIGHVTIRLPVPHFLFVVHCYQVCISSRFRDIQLQSACPVQIVIAHVRYHVTCTPYAKFGYIF